MTKEKKFIPLAMGISSRYVAYMFSEVAAFIPSPHLPYGGICGMNGLHRGVRTFLVNRFGTGNAVRGRSCRRIARLLQQCSHTTFTASQGLL